MLYCNTTWKSARYKCLVSFEEIGERVHSARNECQFTGNSRSIKREATLPSKFDVYTSLEVLELLNTQSRR